MRKGFEGGDQFAGTAPSAKDKGRIVEQVVAAMHELEGVSVARNALLEGSGSRKREVDVLVSGNLAGYPVRVAIECRNERALIGVQRLDAFVGKLADIGIPAQHGVYVSTSGYTRGALARARSAGVRPLLLTGLDERRIASSVAQAFHSVVYLLVDVLSMTITNNVASAQNPAEMLVFFDAAGQLKGSLPDLIRHRWIRGDIPDELGEHEFGLSEVAGWCHESESVEVKIRGDASAP